LSDLISAWGNICQVSPRSANFEMTQSSPSPIPDPSKKPETPTEGKQTNKQT